MYGVAGDYYTKEDENLIPDLLAECEKHNVKYHQLIMGKPWGENVFYVDDKNLTISEFLEH